MKQTQRYVLVLGQDARTLQMLGSLLDQLKYPMVVADSLEQAMVRASQTPPLMIILSGHQNWTQPLIKRLRNVANSSNKITIVALTEFHSPSWLHQDENPGVDGFLVKPIQSDVLFSLLQSAWARQTYCT
ncbi:response regulator [Egbenema bharatensis]|uniref:response regulator n=1 Tax=Egbenema bharatensis TaxID=3463334 RepID=UPI003A855C51